ncbi:MAG: hypothetical protein LCH39_00155 [Proteobacteria bacterium]|nr:hypothetical protein [Pseudomonadota bacterium]
MQRATRTQAVLAGLAGASLLAFWAVTANAQSGSTDTALPMIQKQQNAASPLPVLKLK